MLFNLIQQSIEDDRHNLNDRVIYFSNATQCTKISKDEARPFPELHSNHEEVDTKLLALVKAAPILPGETAAVRSPSAHIDIITLFLAHDFMGVKVLLDSGVGKNRKLIDVTSSTLSPIKRRAVVGLHAFSGNDYVSAFFRKGKKSPWKAMLKRQEFVNAFARLGTDVNPDADDIELLERFTCFLYGFPSVTKVNEARSKCFWKVFERKGIVVDLSLMPPCAANLHLHIARSAYVANINRNADRLELDLESPVEHGWDARGNAPWSPEAFPENVEELLLHANEEDEGDYDGSNDDALEDEFTDESSDDEF
eukprot:gene1870-biopygen1697